MATDYNFFCTNCGNLISRMRIKKTIHFHCLKCGLAGSLFDRDVSNSLGNDFIFDFELNENPFESFLRWKGELEAPVLRCPFCQKTMGLSEKDPEEVKGFYRCTSCQNDYQIQTRLD